MADDAPSTTCLAVIRVSLRERGSPLRCASVRFAFVEAAAAPCGAPVSSLALPDLAHPALDLPTV